MQSEVTRRGEWNQKYMGYRVRRAVGDGSIWENGDYTFKSDLYDDSDIQTEINKILVELWQAVLQQNPQTVQERRSVTIASGSGLMDLTGANGIFQPDGFSEIVRIEDDDILEGDNEIQYKPLKDFWRYRICRWTMDGDRIRFADSDGRTISSAWNITIVFVPQVPFVDVSSDAPFIFIKQGGCELAVQGAIANLISSEHPDHSREFARYKRMESSFLTSVMTFQSAGSDIFRPRRHYNNVR